MPVKPKTKSSLRKPRKSEESVDMGKLQTKVSRDILDTADVTKSQIASAVVEKFSGQIEKENLRESIKVINQLIDKQADSLVDRVIKNLK